MKFYAYRGAVFVLVLPYVLFVISFTGSGNLKTVKNLLIMPVGYALWVIITLIGAVKL
jgi:hypothetical protein